MKQIEKFEDFELNEELNFISENMEDVLEALVEYEELDEGTDAYRKALSAGSKNDVRKFHGKAQGVIILALLAGGAISLLSKLTKLIKRKNRINQLLKDAETPEEKEKLKAELAKYKDAEIKIKAKMKKAEEKGKEKLKNMSPEEKAKLKEKAAKVS